MGPDAARAQEVRGIPLALSLATLQALKLAAGIAGVLGIATGALLVAAPKRLLEGRSAVRNLLLETDLSELFNRRYVIERRVYRWHRIAGATVLIGASAALGLLVFLANDPRSVPLRELLGRGGFRITLGLSGAVALGLLLFGLSLLVRPSILKGIEAAANRWIEPSSATPRFESAHLVSRSPRTVGAALIVAGVCCVWPW